jgi:hypothetical protein
MILVPPQARPQALRDKPGVTLVAQPDHAAVSAHFATQWCRPTEFSDEIWNVLIDTVLHHDDGWIEEELEPKIDAAGNPLHFLNMPLATHLDVWRRSIAMGRARSPLVGLLVAEQARWLYTPRPTKSAKVSDNRSTDERGALQTFLAETGESITALDSGLSPAARECMERARRLLSFLDALSLIMLGAIPAQPWPESLASAGSQIRLTIDFKVNEAGEADYRKVSISPWPFGSEALRVQVSAHHLQQSTFADHGELRTVLAGAARTRIFWELKASA